MAASCVIAASQPSTPAPGGSLIDALGGKPGVAALMEDFVPRLAADPMVGSFFKESNLGEAAKQLTDQVCALAGGDCVYEGADMKKAHADMHIRKSEFDRVVELLRASMNARRIPPEAQTRVLALVAPMERDIVTAR